MNTTEMLNLKVTNIDSVCSVGEEFGRNCQRAGEIPVFSCEGGCIKGEIARQAANLVAKQDGYARACHGELFTVPHADLTKWVREARKIVLIDGCPLFCHARIAEHIIGKDQLVIFDALSIHRKYANLMDVDDVPEIDRKLAAKEVADTVLDRLGDDVPCDNEQLISCGCESNAQSENNCCST
jgi:uncharacterized metal-binding protein